MLWFDQWVSRKQGETIEYTPDKDAKPRKPKYESLAEIFEQYDDTRAMTKFSWMNHSLPNVDMTAVIEEAFGDDVLF